MKSSEEPALDAQPVPFYEFGPFYVDPLKRGLWRGNEPIAVNARAFDTLLALIENRGRTVGKDELMAKVWAGTAVEENNLTQCISVLRKALGENRGENRFIVTVPGHGYRFVMSVREQRREEDHWTQIIASATGPGTVGMQNGADQLSSRPVPEPAPQDAHLLKPKTSLASRRAPPGFTLRNAAFIIVFVIISMVLLDFAFRAFNPVKSHQTSAAAQHEKQHLSNGRVMLAVMPFANLSGDPKQDYLSAGITDEVITRLGRSDPRLVRVIARTAVIKYEHSDKDIRDIGRELGVGYVVEGSVFRSRSQLRVLARLIRVKDQVNVWAKSYNRSLGNPFATQRDVARTICLGLRAQLGNLPKTNSLTPQ